MKAEGAFEAEYIVESPEAAAWIKSGPGALEYAAAGSRPELELRLAVAGVSPGEAAREAGGPGAAKAFVFAALASRDFPKAFSAAADFCLRSGPAGAVQAVFAASSVVMPEMWTRSSPRLRLAGLPLRRAVDDAARAFTRMPRYREVLAQWMMVGRGAFNGGPDAAARWFAERGLEWTRGEAETLAALLEAQGA